MISILRSGIALTLGAALAVSIATRATAAPSWGFRAGWSTSRLHGDAGDVIAPKYRQDFTAGGFVRYPLNRMLSLQPEAAWAFKGGQADLQFALAASGAVEVFNMHAEHRIGYVELPVLMRLDFPRLGAIEPYVMAGPAPAVRVSQDHPGISATTTTQPAPTSLAAVRIFEQVGTFDGAIPTRSFDVGLVGGLGLWLGRGPVRVGLEGRYNYGGLNVNSSSDAEVRTRAFAITTAVEFR